MTTVDEAREALWRAWKHVASSDVFEDRMDTLIAAVRAESEARLAALREVAIEAADYLDDRSGERPYGEVLSEKLRALAATPAEDGERTWQEDIGEFTR